MRGAACNRPKGRSKHREGLSSSYVSLATTLHEVYIPRAVVSKIREASPFRSGIRQALRDDTFARPRVFSQRELAQLFARRRGDWGFAGSSRLRDFIRGLSDNGLTFIEFRAEEYDRTSVRYLWREPSIFSVAMSIRSGSYLSHGTALSLWGWTQQRPLTLYANREQGKKFSRDASPVLAQESVNRAFSRPQRKSRFVYRYGDADIVLLSGKWTGGYGVTELELERGEEVEVTERERTLIDCVVRPSYAGGVAEVARAFVYARSKGISADDLLTTLDALAYVYPYHQALGFYMERAGFPEESLDAFERRGAAVDFYLDYGLKDLAFSRRWRIHYPKSL
jgi:hypothetical protein